MTAAIAILGLSPLTLGQESASGLSYGLDSELRYDDNIYRSESSEKASFILAASPFVKATFLNQGNSYQVGYRLNYAEYFSASADSYDDHEFSADINHRFTTRQAINAKVSHKLLTEQRGTGFSEEPNTLVRSPDDYDATQFAFTYFIGAPQARARVELNATRDVLSFDSSYVGDTRDYKADQLGALLRYRVGARTDLLAEYRNLNVSYDNTPLDANGQPFDLDSDEDYYLAGISWELTAKTRGEVRVGRSERDYDDFSSSNTHWEAELEWRPLSYSEFVLTSGRESLETYGTGRFINVKKHSLAWNHAWRGRVSTKLQAGVTNDDYEDSSRRDDQTFWLAEVFYEPRTWLKLSGGVAYNENDSNFELVNYERNLVFIKANVEL
ncbi:MAG: hypothetical protein VR73_05865 [Gammaproteobacteria bacterium BRH_c0]|nr:MAG: hypothetical protein VR73_05865 [Gammaproteobacteria bacterium BRH_c0]